MFFIAAHCPAERPAAFLAAQDRRKQVLVALPLLVRLKRRSALEHDLLCPVEYLLCDDAEVLTLHNHPIFLVPALALAGQEVLDFPLPIDDLARVKRVRQDALYH